MTRAVIFVAAAALLMAPGCGPVGRSVDETPLPTAPPVDASAPADDAPGSDGASQLGEPGALRPYYIAYSPTGFERARAEGRPILLYFWASWCPVCRAEEPKIIADIEGADVPVAGFRVNFDEERELKSRFRIPYQHTTVILDAEGRETERFLGPVSSDERLRAIRAAHEPDAP